MIRGVVDVRRWVDLEVWWMLGGRLIKRCGGC